MLRAIKINPKLIKGNIKIPASKSISHRAIITAALFAKGEDILIKNLILSKDIMATIDAMRVLGVEIVLLEEKDGTYLASVKSNLRNFNTNIVEENNDTVEIDCNESGSTLRFIIPIALAFGGHYKFIGKGKLVERPLTVFYDIFEKCGISYKNNNGNLPLELSGKLSCGTYKVDGNISSQFVTGLIFALSLVEGESNIIINGQLESSAYVDLTIEVLKDFAIYVDNNDYKEFVIHGQDICSRDKTKLKEYFVEGDYSQAAFFMVGDFIGNDIECTGLRESSIQGDRAIIDILKKFKEHNRGEFIIDASGIPDLVPILTVMASLKPNTCTRIINAGRLRIKECDRLKAIATEMNKLGGDVKELSEGLYIRGVQGLTGGVSVSSWNDHRIAMSLAIAGTVCKNPIVLENYKCVEKSYPDFWDDYKFLGGDINEFNLGE